MNKAAENKIVNDVLIRLQSISDYEEFKNTYESSTFGLTDKTLVLIEKLEDLLDQKNRIEILHTYTIGSKKSGDSVTNIMTQDIDEITELNNLYSSSFEYRRLEGTIKITKANLLKSVSDNAFISKKIHSLIELYSYCNYELLKIAFKYGYISNIKDTIIFIRNHNYKKTLKENIGNKLHYCRTASNLTQEDLSTIFNLDRTLISNYERGKSIPPAQLLLLYAKYFFVDLNDIIDDAFTEEMFKTKYTFEFYRIT